jgi:ABC-2 type transport system ATP-binding protein
MDPKGREDMIILARDLAENKGMSLLFSSHLLPDVEAVCDHVMVLGGGRLMARGRIDELKRRHGRQYLVRVKAGAERLADALQGLGVAVEPGEDEFRIDLPDRLDLPDVWRAAVESDVQVRSLKPRRSTLEEVFLDALRAGQERDAEAASARDKATADREVG